MRHKETQADTGRHNQIQSDTVRVRHSQTQSDTVRYRQSETQ